MGTPLDAVQGIPRGDSITPYELKLAPLLRAFVGMFREASVKLRFGNVSAAIFPKGSFRPSLGFVSVGEELDPLADAGGSRHFAMLAAAAI